MRIFANARKLLVAIQSCVAFPRSAFSCGVISKSYNDVVHTDFGAFGIISSTLTALPLIAPPPNPSTYHSIVVQRIGGDVVIDYLLVLAA